ncbi:conserved membrane hypothetical protein [Tenacibaculum litopenaei]|uniref:sensor histidine kinase n=1 Tax=Tenacibaculum litopenaei TaxID=396016 RepID=UPI003895AFF1
MNVQLLRYTYVKQSLFWLLVFSYFYLTTDISFYEAGYLQVFESILILVFAQFICAQLIRQWLVPAFLNKGQFYKFIASTVLLLFLAYVLYLAMRTYWYEPRYLSYYPIKKQQIMLRPFWEKVWNFRAILSKAIKFVTPAAMLLMYDFYRKQRQLLELNEQKKIAELKVLKQQLNPHFLFNTLNNLYALTLKKSELAPVIIEKLSAILDYMLYGCTANFTSLSKEWLLIENYITLEKIRYGKRVKVVSRSEVTEEVKIAPLIVLTFVENAFKHGVAQELEQATIEIHLSIVANQIVFTVVNSKPKKQLSTNKPSIGLQNVKKQLALLYPQAHTLDISETDTEFSVRLTLEKR